MGLGDMANTAKEKAGENPDKVEKGADAAKDKFGHDEQIDQGAEKLAAPDEQPAPEN